MRYLQTEWHRHERERNIWEIERAEMKSRISRLEGGALTNKRKSETLEKHICMLENALKRERENNKKLRAGEKVEPDSDVNATDAAKENLKAIPKCTYSLLRLFFCVPLSSVACPLVTNSQQISIPIIYRRTKKGSTMIFPLPLSENCPAYI